MDNRCVCGLPSQRSFIDLIANIHSLVEIHRCHIMHGRKSSSEAIAGTPCGSFIFCTVSTKLHLETTKTVLTFKVITMKPIHAHIYQTDKSRRQVLYVEDSELYSNIGYHGRQLLQSCPEQFPLLWAFSCINRFPLIPRSHLRINIHSIASPKYIRLYNIIAYFGTPGAMERHYNNIFTIYYDNNNDQITVTVRPFRSLKSVSSFSCDLL